MAYTTTTDSPSARFAIHRDDASTYQVVTYSTSSQNSLAKPGLDYIAALGMMVFNPGETDKEIRVPLILDSLNKLRSTSVSLEVQEQIYNHQRELNLLIQTATDAASAQPSVISGLQLEVDPAGSSARISMRSDNNDADQNLRMQISTRENAATLTTNQSKTVSIKDFNQEATASLPTHSLAALPLDHDGRSNNQVQLSLALNFSPTAGQPTISILGPDFEPGIAVELINTNQVHFLQEAPLTSWRADSGSGRVSFALVAGATRQVLLSDAEAGSSGSINPANAFAEGWQSTESQAIGSRSITAVPNLNTQAWTPTASRDGVPLALLNLSVDGNQVTASFEGGVTGVFWQASGTEPTLQPVPASLEVQRLAGYENTLGFYSVDAITGLVDALLPGDPGYLQAALARSEQEDLLLDADHLPGYGQSAVFNNLPLDTQKRYGVLLLQNGSRTTIFSSFAAANPMGQTQMVRLASDTNKLTLGLEDLAVASGTSDRDFNDLIINVTGVAVPLL